MTIFQKLCDSINRSDAKMCNNKIYNWCLWHTSGEILRGRVEERIDGIRSGSRTTQLYHLSREILTNYLYKCYKEIIDILFWQNFKLHLILFKISTSLIKQSYGCVRKSSILQIFFCFTLIPYPGAIFVRMFFWKILKKLHGSRLTIFQLKAQFWIVILLKNSPRLS